MLIVTSMCGTAAMIWTASRGPAVRAFGSLAGGTLGVACGAALGVAPLLISGPSATTLHGVATLIAGLFLLVIGATTLLVRLPGWRRLLVIPLALLLVQFAIVPVAGGVFGVNQPRTPAIAEPPMGAIEVSMTTADEMTLSGWYTPSGNGAAVIVLPGSGGTRADLAGTCRRSSRARLRRPCHGRPWSGFERRSPERMGMDREHGHRRGALVPCDAS